jgi:hypothetical protein
MASKYKGYYDIILSNSVQKHVLDRVIITKAAATSSANPPDNLAKPVVFRPMYSPKSGRSVQAQSVQSNTQPPLKHLAKPRIPTDTDCCMGGCAVCVWDSYYKELDDYNTGLKRSGLANEADEPEVNVSMDAFRAMELDLGLKKH